MYFLKSSYSVSAVGSAAGSVEVLDGYSDVGDGETSVVKVVGSADVEEEIEAEMDSETEAELEEAVLAVAATAAASVLAGVHRS
jgi:hypothetical protein